MSWSDELPDWAPAVEALQRADDLVVACHVNPDGDALGSMLGAALAAHKRGARVWASWGASPLSLPFAYRWIPGAALVVQPEELPDATPFLALDCGAADRLGDLEVLARRSPCLINVDHHPGNDNFAALNLVHTGASSTAELVAGLISDLGVEIDAEIATCLYTGIATDTGWFQYHNASPSSLRLAADLLEKGVDAPGIAQQVLDSAPFGYMQLLGRALERAILDHSNRFVYSWITQTDLAQTRVNLDETEKLIDQIRSTRDADVAALFKEQPDGTYRVSLRSKGRPIARLARTRGGGGHELAAGFTASDVEQTVASLVADLAATPTS